MRHKSFYPDKIKNRKPFIYRGFRTFLWGAWRIRTAVDGFADRWLSHSSKAPSKRVKSDTSISSFERRRQDRRSRHHFLNAGAKVVIIFYIAKCFRDFFASYCNFSPKHSLCRLRFCLSEPCKCDILHSIDTQPVPPRLSQSATSRL